MNDLTKYKCGSTPQVGDTVKSESMYTCLLHKDTPYKVLSVDNKSKIYIDIPRFPDGLAYPTQMFSLISRKETSMKINVEVPTRPQTLFSDLKGGDWFKAYSNYYLKLMSGPNDNPNTVRYDGVKAMFLGTEVVIKVIDPVLTGRLES